MRRAGVVLSSLATALVVAACASADHSWRGEFDARLEGAHASVEKTLAEVGPDAAKTEDFTGYANLGRELRYEAELIERLDAPQGCTEVQTRGLDHVKSSGLSALEVHGPDYPPKLLKADRVSLAHEVRVLARLEREAGSCAAG